MSKRELEGADERLGDLKDSRVEDLNDTVPPTAYVTASSSLTNELNVSVNISFTEPCTGGGGFGCSSVNACNLLVYGDGQVIPSSLITLQPGLRYSLLVGLSSTVQFGRAVLIMDKSVCTDTAGNKFTGMENSSFFVHFDRRSVFVNLRSHVPEKLLQLNSETRTVQATNNHENLKVFLYFSELVLNSSADNLNSLNTSQGALLLVEGKSQWNRRFGFMIMTIRFSKACCEIEYNIYFYEISRSIYITEIKAVNDIVSVNVPENVTGDVAGNKNLPSNVLLVRHYSVPVISCVISAFVTAVFWATSFAAGLLTLSTASLLSAKAFSRPSTSLISDPARNLFRIACHIQVFALSRWLAVTLPVEYYEFTRGLQRSIPYFNLPWETGHIMVGSSPPAGPHSYISKFNHLEIFQCEQSAKEGNLKKAATVYGSPLTPMEYRSFFESQDIKPEADYMGLHNFNGQVILTILFL
ncbi:hypothetical protein Dsin_008018 [Dipteronia sinensis]|uniref:Uncharacterized protein n=1 Tax=Dipteronia sinensis TaxID=43782 RepID=A0AAE0EH57_9ROSI|nr:hypothetical protein Dsin_008018 [Dipteronia sinensis]